MTNSGFAGIWLSVYEYYSSGRQSTFASKHHVVIDQEGSTLKVRSLPGSAPSSVTMTLSAEDGVVEGEWAEDTDPNGYYGGARFEGTIRLNVDASGHRLAGEWAGLGRDGETNTGVWTLELLDASTDAPAVERHDWPASE